MRALCSLHHPLDERVLITSVTEYAEVLMSCHLGDELLEYLRLLIFSVGPERVSLLRTVLHNDQANQIHKPRVRIALDIEVHAHRAGGKLRHSEDVDAPVTER